MVDPYKWRWKYFSADELRCKCGCGGMGCSQDFLNELERLRIQYNGPMKVNSCCRCTKHNRVVGGHPRSLHVFDKPQHQGQVGTLAIDIAISGDAKGRLFTAAWQFGWSIGWGKGFLHLDRRGDIGMSQMTFEYY